MRRVAPRRGPTAEQATGRAVNGTRRAGTACGRRRRGRERDANAELDEAISVMSADEFNDAIRELTKSLPPAERAETRQKLMRRYEVRDWLKTLYDDECQVCDFRFKTRNGGWYSEGAHLRRIALRLPDLDVLQNMVILCPDHHKMLDHGFMRIEWDTASARLIARSTEKGDVAMTNKHLGVDASGNFICTPSGPTI